MNGFHLGIWSAACARVHEPGVLAISAGSPRWPGGDRAGLARQRSMAQRFRRAALRRSGHACRLALVGPGEAGMAQIFARLARARLAARAPASPRPSRRPSSTARRRSTAPPPSIVAGPELFAPATQPAAGGKDATPSLRTSQAHRRLQRGCLPRPQCLAAPPPPWLRCPPIACDSRPAARDRRPCVRRRWRRSPRNPTSRSATDSNWPAAGPTLPRGPSSPPPCV